VHAGLNHARRNTLLRLNGCLAGQCSGRVQSVVLTVAGMPRSRASAGGQSREEQP